MIIDKQFIIKKIGDDTIGLRFMKDIKTYGQLCEEIEKTQKAIDEVMNGAFYDQGDEYDLALHKIALLRIKKRTEISELTENGMLKCLNCNSKKTTILKQYLEDEEQYEYKSICDKCGHTTIIKSKDGNCLDCIHDEWYEYH